MLAPDVQKKVSLLQLQVKKLLKGFFAGDYRSKQKGYGIEFEQLRDYQLGDDIRFIDWKSTARTNKMLVKEYIHEHTKTILIALDASNSTCYGSSGLLKKEFIAQVATVLALAADFSKARIGIVVYSEQIEFYIPPGLGSAHLSSILTKLWSFEPKSKMTNNALALKFLAQISKKDTLLFLISDFIDTQNFEKELGIVAQRYDLIALRCLDDLEQCFIPTGFLYSEDCETGQLVLLDCRNNAEGLSKFLKQRLNIQDSMFRKYAIDCLDLRSNRSFIDPLLLFFAKRLVR